MNKTPEFLKNIQVPLFYLLIIGVFIAGCNTHAKKNKLGKPLSFSEEEFSGRLKTLYPAVDTQKKAGIGNIDYNLKLAYQLNEYLPIWMQGSFTPTKSASDFIAELEDVWQDGINPEKYQLTELKKRMGKMGGKETTTNDALALDTMLTRSYLAVAKDLLLGVIVPRKADSLWFHANDSSWAAPKMLADMGTKYLSLNDFRSTFPTYSLLRREFKHYHDLLADANLNAAIGKVVVTKTPDTNDVANSIYIIQKELPWYKPEPNDSLDETAQLFSAYQYYFGLRQTGKADTTTLKKLSMPTDTLLQVVGANMERVRWMQQKFGNLYVLVNVPLMELFLRQNGADSMHMRVVVGKPARQTPSLFATMANVVINPRWGVPPTILKQDVLPGIEKTGKKYLAKKGLKVYDRNGKPVNAAVVNANNYRRYNYQQSPGDDNALGYVKFNLPNPFDIYLHDTPHRGDFGKRDRALSSGCIRVQQPREMAVYILAGIEKRNFTRGKLDSIIEKHKTQWQVLKNKIPVHIAYITAFEDTTNSHLRLLNDVYHRDEKLMTLLAKSR